MLTARAESARCRPPIFASMVYVLGMKFGWYLKRLSSMAPAEIAHRLAERARQEISRRRHEGWTRYPARPLHAVFPDWPGRIRSANPAQCNAVRAAVERFLGGSFEALGRRWPQRDPKDLFPADSWRLDPVTGGLWPAGAYCFEIDFRGGAGLGDVKYVWEFNRLQMLPGLAAFALLEDDARAIDAIEAAIASWYAANPPFRGVGWASGIEVALRSISLIATFSITGDRLSRQTQDRISQILSAGAFWLQRFPSRFSSANNHRVAELAGEALTARALASDPKPAEDELAGEILKQLLPDGTGAEQSPTYAAFTAELALLCVDAARQAGASFHQGAVARLSAFAKFMTWLGPARFGDDDEGRALTLGDEADYAGSVAAAIGGTLGADAPRQTETLRSLLFGTQVDEEPDPHGLKTFEAGGLSVWRGRMAGRLVKFTLDHGPLGYLSIAAHGHADAASMTLAVDGRQVLIDPGTYLYGSGGAWRDWFRSTPAHNTLNIDGESQSLMAGPFNWSHKATASIEEVRSEPHWQLRVRHNGYQSRFSALHERIAKKDGEAIIVTDRLIGAERDAEIVFQLAAGLDARPSGPIVTIWDASNQLLLMQMPDEHFAIRSGREDELASGWVSPRFGVKVPASRIVWRGMVGSGGVTTRIQIPAAP
jgi:hypothetical protein